MSAFSDRTQWQREPNRLSVLLERRRQAGKPIIDLTISNPTACGITYPGDLILKSIANAASLTYVPEPHGILSAREAIALYYRTKGVTVETSQIILTASTSEAYHHLFTLLCNPGDDVLVPAPSYPLFEYLAAVSDVALRHYILRYDSGWGVDTDSLSSAIGDRTRAIVVVHPHNPTGFALKKEEFRRIVDLAKAHNLAIIADEVFSEYLWNEDENRLVTAAGETDVLTFTLNGLSKMAGLPQVKLGWIVAGGPPALRDEGLSRLEILSDTFLSVNTPAQTALPPLLRAGTIVRSAIQARLRTNLQALRAATQNSICPLLKSDGGWYGVLRVPRTRSDEEWAVEILETAGIYLYPGYFFDFEEDGYLVVSLLAEPRVFAQACGMLLNAVGGE